MDQLCRSLGTRAQTTLAEVAGIPITPAALRRLTLLEAAELIKAGPLPGPGSRIRCEPPAADDAGLLEGFHLLTVD